VSSHVALDRRAAHHARDADDGAATLVGRPGVLVAEQLAGGAALLVALVDGSEGIS